MKNDILQKSIYEIAANSLQKLYRNQRVTSAELRLTKDFLFQLLIFTKSAPQYNNFLSKIENDIKLIEEELKLRTIC